MAVSTFVVVSRGALFPQSEVALFRPYIAVLGRFKVTFYSQRTPVTSLCAGMLIAARFSQQGTITHEKSLPDAA